MANQTIYPQGTNDITVPAAYSIAISNFGGGIAKIYYLIKAANAPPAFQFQQTLENSSVTLGAFSTETVVRIEAGGSKVIYDVGSSPDTGIGNADTLGGNAPAYYTNASNLSSGTIADARLPDTITSDITGNAATATNASAVGGVAIGKLIRTDSIATIGVTHVLSNTKGFQVKDTGGTNQDAFVLWSDNKFYFGDADIVLILRGSGNTLLFNAATVWTSVQNASVGSGQGITGSFTTADAKTITVTNGIITAITGP